MSRSFAQLPGYDIGPRLGKGAGAVIYAGVERAGRRRVAIKHVVRRGPEDDRFIAQAETEGDVAQRLDHPSLRKVFDLVRVRRWLKTSELFLVMELVEGQRLDERYGDQHAQRFGEVTTVFRWIAEGLHAMHRAGYVHADMKPNNVILIEGGVKIIDFGQSCPLGSAKDRIQGTPDYIAPEQIRKQALDQRTDVFNLGATMYRVVTGKAYQTKLLAADPGARKIELDSRRDSDPAQVVNPRTPLALSRLIEDCLEDDRNKRPWDMQQVISRLETVQHWLARKREAAAEPTPGAAAPQAALDTGADAEA